MASDSSITIRIRGQEFRIRSEGEDGLLERVADYLDETMSMIEKKTGTVDSLSLAMLTSLNLARELVELREGRAPVAGTAGAGVDAGRLQSLIELAESALESTPN